MDKKQYYEDNKEHKSKYDRIYREENKLEIAETRRSWENDKLQNDPSFRLRKNVSRHIRLALKANDGSKNGKSILEHLPYSFQELKNHLEKQFEPWMNWSNWGKYDIEIWDDNDPLTWIWQIDHIIPHSIFQYSSMADENFQKCWALENLRPYSAKQNYLDGVNRTRHSK